MKGIPELPNLNTVDATAANWIARLDRGGLSEDERVALRDWVDMCPEHYELLNRFVSIWKDLDGLTEIYGETGLPAAARKEAQKRRWQGAIPGVAFIVVSITALISAFVNHGDYFVTPPFERQSVQASYLTGAGEQQTITLQDGSRAQLKTDTILTVDFDDKYRRVRLARGEALFENIPSASRPFLVYAGANVLHVKSTVLAVELTGEPVEVIIKEGQAEIQPAHGERVHPGPELPP